MYMPTCLGCQACTSYLLATLSLFGENKDSFLFLFFVPLLSDLLSAQCIATSSVINILIRNWLNFYSSILGTLLHDTSQQNVAPGYGPETQKLHG